MYTDSLCIYGSCEIGNQLLKHPCRRIFPAHRMARPLLSSPTTPQGWFNIKIVNSLRPSDAIRRHRTGSTLTCNSLLSDGIKSLPEPMLTYYHEMCSVCGIHMRAISQELLMNFSYARMLWIQWVKPGCYVSVTLILCYVQSGSQLLHR